jgi:GGDEF domain-containing protein
VTFEGLLAGTPFMPRMKAMLGCSRQRSSARRSTSSSPTTATDFYLLQCRPQSSRATPRRRDPRRPAAERVVFTAHRYVSNGRVPDLTHIVYVDPDAYHELGDLERAAARRRARRRPLNKLLPKRQFALMGPGRWGSRGDIKLGVSRDLLRHQQHGAARRDRRRRATTCPTCPSARTSSRTSSSRAIRYLPLYPDDCDPDRRREELAILARAGEVREFELDLRTADGATRTVLDSCFRVPDPQGGEDLFHGILVDITTRKRLEARLRELSLHDALTGCYNRRLLEEFAARHEGRSVTWGAVMVDVDRFKHYNDRHGHAAGDRVLRETADFLRAHVRGEDAVVRLGGDEFLVIVLGRAAKRTAARVPQGQDPRADDRARAGDLFRVPWVDDQRRGAGQPRLPHRDEQRHRPLQGRAALPPVGEPRHPQVPGLRAGVQEQPDHAADGRRQGRVGFRSRRARATTK